jgi:hypothetical protein
LKFTKYPNTYSLYNKDNSQAYYIVYETPPHKPTSKDIPTTSKTDFSYLNHNRNHQQLLEST